MSARKIPRTAVMTTSEAAIYVGLSESTLEKMRAYSQGGPPFATLESAIRYRVADLDAWLAARVDRSIRDRKQRLRRNREN